MNVLRHVNLHTFITENVKRIAFEREKQLNRIRSFSFIMWWFCELFLNDASVDICGVDDDRSMDNATMAILHCNHIARDDSVTFSFYMIASMLNTDAAVQNSEKTSLPAPWMHSNPYSCCHRLMDIMINL